MSGCRASATAGETQITSAFIAYSRGVTERLELGALLPYVLYSEEIALNPASLARFRRRS